MPVASRILLSAILITGSSVAAAADQQVAQANRTLRLSALCMQQGQFAFFFENNSNVAVDSISIDLTLHNRKHPNQILGRETAQFEYVDPGAVGEDTSQISERHCSNVDYIRVRDVVVCRIKGVLFPGCRNYLQPDVIEIEGVTP